MKTSSSNPGPGRVRRTLRIVLIGSGLCLAPFVILALVALSYLGLHRDAAVLRQQIFAVVPADWSTRVQVNLGESTLGAVDLGMRFARDEKFAQARDFISAVKRASVGVYRRDATVVNCSRPDLFTKADQAMEKQGWVRLVGVVDEESTVLVYSPRDGVNERSVEVCVAVLKDRDLVIVAAKLDAGALDELIRKNGLSRWRDHQLFLTQN